MQIEGRKPYWNERWRELNNENERGGETVCCLTDPKRISRWYRSEAWKVFMLVRVTGSCWVSNRAAVIPAFPGQNSGLILKLLPVEGGWAKKYFCDFSHASSFYILMQVTYWEVLVVICIIVSLCYSFIKLIRMGSSPGDSLATILLSLDASRGTPYAMPLEFSFLVCILAKYCWLFWDPNYLKYRTDSSEIDSQGAAIRNT